MRKTAPDQCCLATLKYRLGMRVNASARVVTQTLVA